MTDISSFRVNNPPSGLSNWPRPVVWIARHPEGCYLTIERLGPACAVTWHVAPHRYSNWLDVATFCDSLDYDSNFAQAESMCELLMESECPTQMIPRVAQQMAREAAAKRAAEGTTSRPVGRPRKTDDEKLESNRKRAERFRHKQNLPKELGPLPWKHDSGLEIDVMDYQDRVVIQWYVGDYADDTTMEFAPDREAGIRAAVKMWQAGPRKEFIKQIAAYTHARNA